VRRSPAVSHSVLDYDETMQTNVTASWQLCKAIGRYWLDNKMRGKIVNLSSILGFVGAVDQAPYAMSKGAIELMTKSLSNEWASKGINVNNISPG
jgi:2-dehydro-3-deoxy-D-gluconate 5-dehydrogenase